MWVAIDSRSKNWVAVLKSLGRRARWLICDTVGKRINGPKTAQYCLKYILLLHILQIFLDGGLVSRRGSPIYGNTETHWHT
jgi:hypothetical protein